MSHEDFTIIDSYICDFYTKNPNFNFQKINLAIIEVLDSIGKESSIKSLNKYELNNEIYDKLNRFFVAQKDNLEFNKLNYCLNEVYKFSPLTSCQDIQIIEELDPKFNLLVSYLKEDNILIHSYELDEIKYSNASKKIVDEFITNVKSQNKCNGIFLSQSAGIYDKSNYNIDINDGRILMYAHNVNFNPEKIALICEIVYSLSKNLKPFFQNIKENGFTINFSDIEKFKNEYSTIFYQRNNIIDSIKSISNEHKKMIVQLESMKLPELKDCCNKMFSLESLPQYICPTCSLTFPTSKSLGSHKKFHK